MTVIVTGGGSLARPGDRHTPPLRSSASFNVVNLVAGLVYVIALPFAAITQTYLYYDLRVAEKLAPAEAVPAVLPAEL